jgi:hypothetical protein
VGNLKTLPDIRVNEIAQAVTAASLVREYGGGRYEVRRRQPSDRWEITRRCNKSARIEDASVPEAHIDFRKS